MFVGAVLEGAYSFPGGLRGRERPQVPHLSARFHGAPLSTRHTTEHHRQHTRRAPSTHPQRDGPRGGVVDGSPRAQRTSSTVRRPPGSAGAGRWKTTLFLVCGRALITDVVPTSRFWTDDQDETPLSAQEQFSPAQSGGVLDRPDRFLDFFEVTFERGNIAPGLIDVFEQ